jgi:hypothetical protein
LLATVPSSFDSTRPLEDVVEDVCVEDCDREDVGHEVQGIHADPQAQNSYLARVARGV